MAERNPCPKCSITSFSPQMGVVNYNVKVLLGDGNCDGCQSAKRTMQGTTTSVGSKDGSGAGDHDEPYVPGRAAKAVANMAPEVHARLLKLRGDILERRLARHIQIPDPDGF